MASRGSGRGMREGSSFLYLFVSSIPRLFLLHTSSVCKTLCSGRMQSAGPPLRVCGPRWAPHLDGARTNPAPLCSRASVFAPLPRVQLARIKTPAYQGQQAESANASTDATGRRSRGQGIIIGASVSLPGETVSARAPTAQHLAPSSPWRALQGSQLIMQAGPLHPCPTSLPPLERRAQLQEVLPPRPSCPCLPASPPPRLPLPNRQTLSR